MGLVDLTILNQPNQPIEISGFCNVANNKELLDMKFFMWFRD